MVDRVPRSASTTARSKSAAEESISTRSQSSASTSLRVTGPAPAASMALRSTFSDSPPSRDRISLLVRCPGSTSTPSEPHRRSAASTHRAFADSVAEGASTSKLAFARKTGSRGPNSSPLLTKPVPMGSSASLYSAYSTSRRSDGQDAAKWDD